MVGFDIRPYNIADRDFVVHGLTDLQAIEYGMHDSRLAPDVKTSIQYLSESLKEATEKSGGFLVAENAATPVGFASYWIEDEHIIYEKSNSRRYGLVADLWVDSGFRRQGIAQLLLDRAAELCREIAGIDRLRLTALTENKTALATYEKAGFGLYETTLERQIRKRARSVTNFCGGDGEANDS